MRGPSLQRVLSALALALGVVAVAAPPVLAHATFAEVGVPANSDQRLNMFVPEERGEAIHNVAIDVQVPAGWSSLACEAAPLWSCSVQGGTVIRWTKAAGAPPSPADTLFVFTVRTGPPGLVGVKVAQTYDSGEVVRWFDAADSETPMAFVEVLQPGTPPPPTTTTTTTAPPDTTVPPASGGPTTTAAPRATTTVARATTTSTAAPAATTTAPPETTLLDTTTTVTETTTTTTPSTTTTTELAGTAVARTGDSGGSGATALVVVLVFLVAAGAAVGWSQWRRRKAPGDIEA